MAASGALWRTTIGPGEDLELDEFKSRQSLDEWLIQPVGVEAEAEAHLLSWLKS